MALDQEPKIKAVSPGFSSSPPWEPDQVGSRLWALVSRTQRESRSVRTGDSAVVRPLEHVRLGCLPPSGPSGSSAWGCFLCGDWERRGAWEPGRVKRARPHGHDECCEWDRFQHIMREGEQDQTCSCVDPPGLEIEQEPWHYQGGSILQGAWGPSGLSFYSLASKGVKSTRGWFWLLLPW